jgi:hypothetical protein
LRFSDGFSSLAKQFPFFEASAFKVLEVNEKAARPACRQAGPAIYLCALL